MVEQIRINPEEVRGYGNICEEHSLEDFIVSSSGLAKEKETVHGALTEVYKLVYSLYGLIFSFDKGNKQLYLHSDNDDVVGFSFSEKSLVFNTVSHISFAFDDKNLVVDDEHYLFIDSTGDLSKYSGADSRVNASSTDGVITLTWVSGNYRFFANKPGTTADEFDYTGDFTAEFDLLSNGNNATIQIYDNSASTFYNKTLDQLNGMKAGHYKIVKTGQTFKTFVDGVEKTTQQVDSDITGACRVGFRGNSASTIKFKNFKIYGG